MGKTQGSLFDEIIRLTRNKAYFTSNLVTCFLGYLSLPHFMQLIPTVDENVMQFVRKLKWKIFKQVQKVRSDDI